MKQRIAAYIKDITEKTGSPTFCPLPWLHVATRPNGDMRICCVANASGADTGDYSVGLVKNEKGQPANFGNSLPEEAFNNEYMKSVRTTMLDGKIPASCKKCFDEEAQGIVSKRLWETATWRQEGVDEAELIAETSADGTIPFKLQYLDLRLGNTCNLKCLMCSPHDSSQWVGDHKKVFPLFQSNLIKKQMEWDRKEFNNKWHENPAFWDQIYEQIPNIKQLYFAGGEPLMIREHTLFLKEIIKRGYAKNISIRYNSNGVLVNDEIIEVWKHFKVVKYSCSLDGIGEQGHYIRYPLDWKTVEENLWRLENTPDNIMPRIACAVQILNIKHIPDFIKWKVNSKFKKLNMETTVEGQTLGGGLMSVHLVWIPTWLSLRVLPKEDKLEVRRLFAELKEWLWENYTQSDEFWNTNPHGWRRWESILDWMDSDDQSDLLPDFREYITKMDALRKTKFTEVFPDLAHLLDQ
jgi:organic radical activating enzyme